MPMEISTLYIPHLRGSSLIEALIASLLLTAGLVLLGKTHSVIKRYYHLTQVTENTWLQRGKPPLGGRT